MEYQNLVNKFEESYRQIFEVQKSEGSISWAQHKKSNPNELVSPTIPFVGKNYFAQKTKILLYASAENLVGYNGYLDDDSYAINRHRSWFDTKSYDFFPKVHLKPIEDGSLVIVLRYICEKLGIEMPDTPKDFLESISFANFGKFSIQPKEGKNTNIDYPNDKQKMDCSMPYVKVDLELLHPDIIVMFKSIYGTESQNINAIKGNAQIIRIYQINAGTVNRLISKKNSNKDENELSPVIREWYDRSHFNQNGFTGTTRENYLSVFTYLDNILKQQIIAMAV